MKHLRFPGIENKPQTIALAALFIGNLCFINFLSRYARTIIPGTGDEYSIVFQSRTFAKLWLSAPPPPLPEFFRTDLVVVQNNRWFGVNPPVYPLMLSPGSLIHNEALIVSLLSSSILVLLFFLVKNIYRDIPLAWLTVLIFWPSPSFLFYSASYYNHIGALLILLICLNLLFHILESKRYGLLWVVGLLVGLGAGIRPYTFMCLAFPLAIFILIQVAREKRTALVQTVPAFAAMFLVFLILLLYNRELSGSFTQFPYFESIQNYKALSLSNFNAANLRRLGGMLDETLKWLFALGNFGNLKRGADEWNLGIYLGVIAMLFGVGKSFIKNTSGRSYGLLFLGLAFALVIGHIFYDYPVVGGRYGERFFFEVMFVPVLFLSQLLLLAYRALPSEDEKCMMALGIAVTMLTTHYECLEKNRRFLQGRQSGPIWNVSGRSGKENHRRNYFFTVFWRVRRSVVRSE